jgi:tRNA pseudouridine38-40 synthase
MELQYDGTGLYGWSKQEGLPTVEGCLQEAFATVLGSTPALRVAGRTDTGVHARRQVVSLPLPKGTDLARLLGSLNALTPSGIAVTRLSRAPESFNARRDAVSRTYRYFLYTTAVSSPFLSLYCWQRPGELNQKTMREVAQATMGKHDFTAFTPVETGHTFFRRTILRCMWRRVPTMVATAGSSDRRGGVVCLEIEADGFLRHMVRTLVGTMVEVGEGKRDPMDFRQLLDGGSRVAAGPTAPAHGLFFWNVKYGGGGGSGECEDCE